MNPDEDEFSTLWSSLPTTASSGGDEFSRVWNEAPGPGAEPSIFDRLKQALSPRAHRDAAVTLGRGAATLMGGAQGAAALRSIPALIPGGETPQDAYARALAEEQGDRSRIRAEAPVASAVAEAIGASIPMMFAPGASGIVSVGRSAATGVTPRALPKAAAVAKEAGAVGGTYGYTEAEGGVGNRAIGGAIGAGAGLAGAGVLSAAALPLSRPVAGAAGRAVVGGIAGGALDDEDRLRGAMIGAGALAVAPHAARQLRGMGQVGAVGDDVSRVADPVRAGAEPQFKERSLVQVLKALRGDNPDLDLEAFAAAPATGRPMSIMEQGANVRGLGRAARTVGERAKQEIPEVLTQRSAGQEERILSDLLETTGLRKRSGVVETVDELTRRRSREAAPLYEAAYANPAGNQIDDPTIRELLLRPSMKRATARAKELASEEGVELADDVLNLRTLDYIKRALDDDLFLGAQARKTGQGGLGPGMERAALGNRATLLSRLDEIVPEYGQARSASAGPAAERDAFESGLELFKMRPAEAQKMIDQMGDAEREQFRRGAMEAVSEKLEGTSQRFDVTKRRPLDDSTLDRQRLRLLFDDDEGFEAFKARLAEEVEMARTQGFVTGGSNTMDKAAEVANLFDLPIEQMAMGGQGGLIDALRSGGKWAVNRARAGYTAKTADDLVDPLLAGARGDAEKFEALKRALRDLAQTEIGRQRREQPIRRGVSAALGGRFGGS